MNRLFTTVCLAAVAVVGSASIARAQDVEALRKQWLLPETDDPLRAASPLAEIFRGAPGASTGTPLAWGAGMGDLFAGGGYQSRTRTYKLANGTWAPDNNKDDGSISFGFGLGDADETVGLMVVATSLSTFRSGFGNRTSFSFQAFHNIDNTMAVAIGVENAFISGGGKTDGTDSWYGVASKVFTSPLAAASWVKSVVVSGGLGNGRFRFIDDVNKDRKTINAFGSIGVAVHDQVSLITDWTGQDLNVGMSVVPFKAFPIVLTPALVDVTGTANKGARFTLGAGIGMHF